MLVREFTNRMDPSTLRELEEGRDGLKKRMDVINLVSLTRLNKLTSGQDDLEKYREEFEEFETWMKEAERNHEQLMRGTARDYHSIKEQIEEEKELIEDVNDHKGDLKFINRAGQKLIDSSREYKQSLIDFRTKNLPSQMNRTFAETPDSNIIKDELADVYERYTRLKAQSRDHYKKMKDLADKHQKYDGVARTVLPWITEAYQKLVSEVQEPVAAEPDIIQSQMETVKALHDDIVLHSKDVTKMKDFGKELAQTQDSVKDSVLNDVRDVSEKYSTMEAELAERSNQLQSALAQSHSVQESLDSLIRWLDQAEKATNRVLNASIIVRKETLLELVQEQKVSE
ncbi:putative dystonin isoform X1 [Apostichopus japonicus]|uniref:Putative dystonin isoform X1 n=1 Tax=Stichopus japonicus TaxID=307972 RepID=A0A2G8KQX0_STIJA|nr:putative dystonin isoform X1 [Apostichopus japonicus]